MRKVKRNELGGESGAVDFIASEAEHSIPQSICDALLAIDGVEGLGLGGVHELWVYVRDGAVRFNLPERIDGFDVHVRITGVIRAQ